MLVLFAMNGEAILQRFGNMQAVTSDKEGRWKGGETRTGSNQARQCGRRVRRGKILNSSELRRCKWHTVAYVCMRETALRFNFAAMMDSSRVDRQKEKSFDWKQTRPSRAQRMPFVRFRHCRTNPRRFFLAPSFLLHVRALCLEIAQLNERTGLPLISVHIASKGDPRRGCLTV